ncbi:hypothetical protein ENUP19_0049G0020 [Entamoeba nuttalli]
MSFFGFGGPTVNVNIQLDENHRKKTIFQTENKEKMFIPIYTEKDTVFGTIEIQCENKKCEHNGIKMELLGIIENDSSKIQKEFLRNCIDICGTNTLSEGITTYPFTFGKIEKKYNSYYGNIGRIRYIIKCTIQRFSKIIKEIEIGVINKSPHRIKKSFETTLTRPILMHFAVESITYEVNDIIHGLLKVVTSKNYSSDIFTSINLELIKKEIFSTEKITKELSKKIIEIEVLKGVPESDEIIPFNLILPTEKLSPSFKTIEGFSLQYFLIINVHLKDTSNSKTEIPINILKEEQTKILFDEKMNGMLEWLDEMDKFEEIIPQDFGETPLIKQSLDEFNNVEEFDSLHDLKEAEEKLKSDACLIKKVEFDW